MAKPTETPIKISVFLPPKLHIAAKIRAARAGVSLSQLVAALVAESLQTKGGAA